MILRLSAITGVLAALVVLRVTFGHYNGISPWLLLSAIAAGCLLCVELLFRVVPHSAATRARVQLLVGTTLLMLFVAEAAFRYTTIRWASYPERNGSVYVSPFQGEPTWFHTLQGRHIRNEKSEFTHVRTINSLGFPDREFVVAKEPGEYRILALGDSFTEGVGTSAETTWVKVTEARLAERYPARRITSLNAGVSGSDPYFAHMLLKEKLQPLRPDLVILALNTSDLNDMIMRGGSERFRPDGTVSFSTRPSWERIYATSYIARVVVHEVLGYDVMFLRRRDTFARQREAGRLLGVALDSLRDLCRSSGMDFLVVSHPQQPEIEQERYTWPAYGALIRRLERDPDLRFVDLMKYYTRHGLMTKEHASEFFWPLDYHHNTEGYRIMGEAIAANIIEGHFIPADSEAAP